MMMGSALFQNNTLIWICIVLLAETTVRVQTCRSTRTHYSDPEPSSLCPYSLILRAQWRSNKYQLYSPLLEPTIYRTRGEHANHYTTHAVPEQNEIVTKSGRLLYITKNMLNLYRLPLKCLQTSGFSMSIFTMLYVNDLTTLLQM